MRARLVLALLLFVVFCGGLVQKAGCNQTSHWLLTRALVDGTARIDPWQGLTCDKSYFEGHFFSNKAPGLALLTVPFYAAVDAAGLMPTQPRRASWVLGLWGAVLPAALLLVLLHHAAERIEPGSGLPVALLLGLTTLTLPFSTMLFAHALSALLLFASFLLAWTARSSPGPARLVLAGLLGGYAVVVEYPVALVTFLIGLYVLVGPGHIRAALLYAAGVLVSVVPAALYNQLAFGSVAHMPQDYGVIVAGQSGHDIVLESQVGDGTFFGVGPPSLNGLAEVVASARGLAVATPIVVLGLASLPLLWRRGLRAEAGLAGLAFAVVLAWNAGFRPAYGHPIGGDVPGPRYLIPVLPFAVLPLAAALRSAPRTIGLLAAVSAATMVAATLTEPLLGFDDTSVWFTRLAHGNFTHTVLTLAGLGSGWSAAIVSLVMVGLLLGLAGASIPWRHGRDAWWLAGGAAVTWAVFATYAPGTVHDGSRTAMAAVLAALGTAVGAFGWLLARVPGRPWPRP